MKMMNMERALVEQQQREEQQRQIIETLRTQNLVIQQSLMEKQQQTKEIVRTLGVRIIFLVGGGGGKNFQINSVPHFSNFCVGLVPFEIERQKLIPKKKKKKKENFPRQSPVL